MCRLPLTVFLLSLTALAAVGGRGGELLTPELPPEKAIDQYIDAELQRVGVSAAPPIDDANFLRRATLDLAGRPPTLAEAKSFLADEDLDKRDKLVRRLVESPAFIRQQAAEFDAWLMEGTNATIREYLARAFRERRSWDRMFRELVVGEPDDPRQQGAIRYLAARAKDPDRITNDVSVMFFGVNVSCAKCHDHPLVADWTQDHYYGMFSFFSRTFDASGFLGERDYGSVTYKTVSGESRPAPLMFLSGKVVDEPPSPEPDAAAKRLERKWLEELKQKKEPPPPPAYSRRGVLVATALADEEPFFARAIVNHVWNQFFGRGLVMPLDQMHSENPPSHPELLDWLARDMRTSGYDLTRLVLGITLSRAYARSSRWDSAAERPADELFAVAQVRPLKPWQYGTTLKLATADPDELLADLPAEELERRIQKVDEAGRAIGSRFQLPTTADFQVGIDEALWLSNSEEVARELLADGAGTLVGRLAKCDSTREAVELASWTVLARPPAEVEVEVLSEFVDARADNPREAYRQVVWALLTSSECRFNY